MNKALIDGVKGLIDGAYEGRDYARFFVLETVARVPYFAYLSVLHLRESLGHRDADHVAKMRVHYAEADNELHHLLIMEALGGAEHGLDRLLASCLAFGYYWYVCAVYASHPQLAYHLSELIEDHAFETYDAFLRREETFLRSQPVPQVARDYYCGDDTFLFDLVTTAASGDEPPRPALASLYDVFERVRDDERAHWETLVGLVQFEALREPEGATLEPTLPCTPVKDGGCLLPDDGECPVPAAR